MFTTTLYAVFFMVASMSIMTVMYYQIFQVVYTSRSNVQKLMADGKTAVASSRSASSTKAPKRTIADPQVKLVLKRSLLLVGSFLMCYAPYSVMVFYEIFSSQRVPPIVDQLFSDVTTLSATLDFLIFILMNGNYKSAFLELIGKS